jgi:hypothetical protein
MLAIVRPDAWNGPLLIHVLGAVALVATLVLALLALGYARRRSDPAGTRFAFRTLLLGVLPAYVVMRVGAQLVQSKEHLADANYAWLDIGFVASDMGALLLLVALVVTGVNARRAARGQAPSPRGLTLATVLGGLLLAAYVVAIFAMTAKPS